MKHILAKKSRASALVISMIVLGIVLTSALSLSLVSVREEKAAILSSRSGATFQSADKGIEVVMNEISNGGHSKVSEILPSKCSSSSKKITDSDEKYEVTFLDENKDKIDCSSDTNISNVYYLRSVGTQAGQSQRAIEAPVFHGP
jgi:hypothetical protein